MDGSYPPLPVLSREAFVRIAVITFPTNNNRLDTIPPDGADALVGRF